MSDAVVVPFIFQPDKEASLVEICGTFNKWTRFPMKKCPAGWKLNIKLYPGNHEYKYMVDNKMQLDETNHKKADGGGVRNVIKVEWKLESDMDETVEFISKGDAGVDRKNRMGIYFKTNRVHNERPVFEQVDKQEEQEEFHQENTDLALYKDWSDKFYLFVGPDGCWRVGSHNLGFAGSVLKHPEKNTPKWPPKTGWLYLKPKWIPDESLQAIMHGKEGHGDTCETGQFFDGAHEFMYQFKSRDASIKYPVLEESKEEKLKDVDNVEVVSDGEAGVYRKDRMGTYLKWDEWVGALGLSLPTFWQVDKNEDEETISLWSDIHHGVDNEGNYKEELQYILYIGPDGCWRVGPNIQSYSGSVMKNPKKCQKFPPKTGWQYLKKWHQDDSLEVHVKIQEDEPETVECCTCPIVEEWENVDSSCKVKNVTCLGKAILDDSAEEVCRSLRRGCAVNFDRIIVESQSEQDVGWTPLMLAARYSSFATFKALVDQAATYTHQVIDIRKKTQKEETAMTLAVKRDHSSREDSYKVVKALKKLGVDPEWMDSRGYSHVSRAVENDRDDGVQYFVDDVQSYWKGEHGQFSQITSLGISVLEDDIAATETNLQKGCDINFDETLIHQFSPKDGGWTSLMLACRWSKLPIVSLLVRQPGIELNKENENGETALVWAANRSDIEMVKLLVEAGANLECRDEYGYSLLHGAVKNGELDLVKYLHSKGADIKTKREDSRNIKNRTTPLWTAVSKGNLAMVEFLTSQGASLDNVSPHNPLDTAVSNGDIDMVKILIEKGIDVNQEREGAMTYLEIARKKMKDGYKHEIAENKPRFEEIIRMLKAAGAKEPDQDMVNKLVVDAMNTIMKIYIEKIPYMGFDIHPSWDWPNDAKMPSSVTKLQTITQQKEVWLLMVKSLLDVIPIDDPLGPTVIILILTNCPIHVGFHPPDVVSLLEVFGMTSTFKTDDSRYRAMSVILSVIAGMVSVSVSQMGAFAREVSNAFLTPSMLDYLFSNLKPGTPPDLALFSLLALENFADKNEHCHNTNLETITSRFAEFSDSEHPLLRLEKLGDSDSCLERQLGFVARWFLDNLFQVQGREVPIIQAKFNTTDHHSERIKIGSTGYEVRCDAPRFESVWSPVAPEGGSWYYEVLIVTNGIMQIGWAAGYGKFLQERGHGVGDDEFSQGYDGCRQIAWHNARKVDLSELPRWKPGDIVGSLIDIEKKEIVFSVNGVCSKPLKRVFQNAESGFYPAASLMSFQQCEFNFGKVPFKHPPKDRPFKPLTEARGSWIL